MTTKTKPKPKKPKKPKPPRPATISLELRRLIGGIPGYDPFRDAGDCVFDEDMARVALDFFSECLTFTGGEKAGEPFALEPWEGAIVANLWGWRRPDDTRRYRRVLIYVPRGNGKSEFGAGLINLELYCKGLRGGQIFSAAAKRDQTRYVFDPVARMIRNDPDLNARAQPFKFSIVVGDATYRAICSEASGEHGGATDMAVVDEVHAHRNRELIDVLVTSTGKRRDSLIVYLTTSDWDRPSICNEIYDYAVKVRDGVIEAPEFLPVIFEAKPEDDWRDPEIWQKANPNWGVTVREDFLREECQRAVETPAFENTFKRLYLNVRTAQSVKLIPMDQWDRCRGKVDAEALKGKPCVAGLDLATVKDLAALVLLFGNDDEGYDVLPYFWCPREEAEKRDRRDRVPYLTWARQGLIELTDGNSIDYRLIRKRINELGRDYQIQEIGFDPYNASMLCTALGEEDGFEMVQVRQGMLTMSPPTKLLLRLLLDGKLRHGGNAVLRWNAANAAGKTDHAENLMPDKEKSGEKIDGLVALVVALSRAIVRKSGRSVYDDRDPRWV